MSISKHKMTLLIESIESSCSCLKGLIKSCDYPYFPLCSSECETEDCFNAIDERLKDIKEVVNEILRDIYRKEKYKTRCVNDK